MLRKNITEYMKIQCTSGTKIIAYTTFWRSQVFCWLLHCISPLRLKMCEIIAYTTFRCSRKFFWLLRCVFPLYLKMRKIIAYTTFSCCLLLLLFYRCVLSMFQKLCQIITYTTFFAYSVHCKSYISKNTHVAPGRGGLVRLSVLTRELAERI